MRSAALMSRVLVATVSAAVVGGFVAMPSAQADNPSVGEIQVRLVQMRQDLNSLYSQSAAASEQLNGASYRLQEVRADLEKRRAELDQAQASVDAYREEVEAMTVERFQTHARGRALVSMFDGHEPAVLLERASARTSVEEAMTAELDALDAREVVLDAGTQAVEALVADQERARADQASAQKVIDQSIAEAERLAASAETERDTLLRQLAIAQERPIAEVTAVQDALDERLDESGPSGPPAATIPTTAPTSPPATTPPATTPPTTAPPKPTPTTAPPKPTPTPDPPPASGSKVEKAIAYARAQLGEKYKWGGAGPSSWDCSGLTMRAWQSAGVGMSHYAGSQYTGFSKVSVSKIKRGDLLFWSNGSAGSIYHVAMYLGGGQMIHSPRPGRTVEIVPLNYWIKPDLASRPG